LDGINHAFRYDETALQTTAQFHQSGGLPALSSRRGSFKTGGSQGRLGVGQPPPDTTIKDGALEDGNR
jgi:hypothetical protein